MNAADDSSCTSFHHSLRDELTAAISDIVYSTSVPMINTPCTNQHTDLHPSSDSSCLDSWQLRHGSRPKRGVKLCAITSSTVNRSGNVFTVENSNWIICKINIFSPPFKNLVVILCDLQLLYHFLTTKLSTQPFLNALNT